ncbi:hypothetical protein Tco_0813253 [Tanacetum coccineum]
MNDECIKSHNDMIESRNELLKTMQSLDDDEDSIIPLNEITSQIPPSIAITPVLLTIEPEDSLIIRGENLSTIPEKESDEVIKSSVEDLIPIPSESEDTSNNDSECDLPFCDDSSPLDIFGGNSITFSNPLSDSNDDFTSSNDELLPEEDDIDCENSLLAIDEPFLFNTPPPSSNLVSLEEVENFDPSLSLIRSGIITRMADIPSLELNEDECFDPGGGEIDADIPPDFEDDYYNLKGDIIYLESVLINDTIPNLPLEMFLDHDPKSLNVEPNLDDLKIKENVRFTFEDRHYLSLTFVIKIFLSFLTYPVNSLLLLSSESEDTIFDPSISVYSFYSLERVAYESPMMIFPFFCFCPMDKGIREIPSGESKVHIEVLSVLCGNRLPIPDGSLPLSSRLKGGGNNNNKNCGLIKVYCLWSVRSRCGSFQKKAHSKNNKSETDKSLLDHGRLAYRCGSFQKGRGSPGRNKTPGPWSARIPMWQLFKGPRDFILYKASVLDS